MIKIFIDPGHGGIDSGAVYGNLVEKNMNLVTAQSCKAELIKNGIDVLMSREDDTYSDLNVRAKKANDWGADYVVSIHYNAGGGDGAEVIHSVFYGQGTEIAKKILGRVCSETSQNSRGELVRWNSTHNADYFGIIRDTDAPACIIESAFIDSNDRLIADTEDEQKKFGIAIAHGILDQLGIATTVQAPVPTPIVEKDMGAKLDYTPNAVIVGDFLFTRDYSGNVESGHQVDVGDEIQVLDVSYSKQLAYVQYPTPSGSRKAYVKNCGCIKYLNVDNWHNRSTSETVYLGSDCKVQFGKLNPHETATKLYMEGDITCIVYNTDKGPNTKSGFVRFKGL